MDDWSAEDNVKISFVSPRVYLYLSPGHNQPAGGAQRQQSMVMKELANRGHEVSAIVADYGQDAREEHYGVTVVKGVPDVVSGPLSSAYAVYTLARAMIVAAADIYVVGGAPRLASVTYVLSRMLRKRFVFRLVNDSDVNPSYLRGRYSPFVFGLYRVALRGADAVLAQTQRQQELLTEAFETEATLVPYGYHLPPSSAMISHDRRDGILWVGSSDPDQKNPGLFLELAEQLPEVGFTMISQPIAGREACHEGLRRQAMGVANVEFVGPVAPDEIHSYYRKAMILVNTSDYEGFPNTFLEAWRYATPVASLYFDLDGLLSRRLGGVLAGSMGRLVSQIGTLASDAELRGDLGRSGRKYMRENFSRVRVADIYERVLKRVCAA